MVNNCISCLRGFYDECGHVPAPVSSPANSEPRDLSGPIEVNADGISASSNEFDSNELGEPLDREHRKRRQKPDDAVRDQQSTGRKRAARLYPLNRENLCEWWDASEDNPKGGGSKPVTVGCVLKNQQARHHGPDKNTLNNELGNVHRICHYHHNLWHRQNDPNYDPNKPLKD